MNKKILICIPVFNGEKTLKFLLEEIIANKDLWNADILIVDDGSQDNTKKIALEYSNYIFLLEHKENKGKGEALKTAFNFLLKNEDKYEAILTIDADLQHDPKEIPLFLAKKNEYDMIIGSRLHDLKTMPYIRRFPNILSSFITSKIIGQKINDSQSGYRLIKTELIKQLDLKGSGYELETEIILQAGLKKFKIGFIKIKTIYNESKSYFKIYHIWIITKTLWHYLINRSEYENNFNK